MYPDAEEHVSRAADEFRAAHAVATEEARKAHLEMAHRYVELIQVRGSRMTVRYLATRAGNGKFPRTPA
jgi:hypothetical protein